MEIFISERYAPWAKQNFKWWSTYSKRLNKQFSYFLKMPMSEISTAALDKWRTQRKEAGIAAATINRDINIIRACLSKAVEWGVLLHNPLAKCKPDKVGQNQPRYLSSDEEDKLYQALKERDQAIKEGRARGNVWRKERNYAPLPTLHWHRFGDHLTPMVIH